MQSVRPRFTSWLRLPRHRYVWRVCAATLALCTATTVWFSLAYPGCVRGMTNDLYYGSIEENANLYQCISYWLEYMEKLSFNESRARYDFDAAWAAAGDDDGERGRLSYHRGEFDQAVMFLERSIREDGATEDTLFWAAMSWLRKAENDNCLRTLMQPTDQKPSTAAGQATVCSLPLQCCHDRETPSRRAAELFQRLLDEYDSDDRLYRWLLNFCHMTLGTYPDGVPEAYRIRTRFTDVFYGEAARTIRQQHTNLVFRDQARELNVATNNAGRGAAVEDFDGDGFLDIITGGSFSSLKFYANHQGREFVDRTESSGLHTVMQPFCLSAADYDNDGAMDLFVARPFDCFRLLHNDGRGRFVDVTRSSGLLQARPSEAVAASWISAWGDVDKDGDLDLFVAQWAMALPFVKGLMSRPRMNSILYLNQGDGKFEDGTDAFGLTSVVNDQYFIGAAFGDYNGDGYCDLLLSSPLRNTSVLLRNVDGGRFAATDLIPRTEGGFVAAFVDVNHDGRLDIFQSGFSDARTSTRQTVFGEGVAEYESGHSTILLQTDGGRFAERNDFFGGHTPMATMGANYGDLNNDGAYDFYLGTGNPEGWFVLPNLMYLGRTEGSRCNGKMTNVSMLNGWGTIQKGHGIVFFDFDEDGDQDVFSSLGGMWPGDAWPDQFFVNHSELDNAWIKIRLRGRETNRSGVGARIRITAANKHGEPIVRYYHMDNKTGFGSAPYLAHIGLLDAVSVTSIEVHWPVSGRKRTYPGTLRALNVLDEADGQVSLR